MTEFREILVLGSGRSGSNLLSSMLARLEGNAAFYEIFIDDRIPVPTSYKAIVRGLLDHYAAAGESLEDPAILRARDTDPVAFYEALAAITQRSGHSSMSCKIFTHQITLENLDILLQRPNLSVIFLTRSRIHRHISGLKGKITNAYAKMDTTHLRPALTLQQFLRQAFKVDQELDAMRERVIASGVPFGYLSYEADLDIEPDLRFERVASVLRSVGAPASFRNTGGPEVYTKQDVAEDWRDKIENGFEVSAALAGLGLSNWAESAPLAGAATSTDRRPAAPIVTPPDRELLDRYSNYRVLCADPLITFSAIDNDRSYFAEWMAGTRNLFPGRRGLHFVKTTWSMETTSLQALVQSFRQAERSNPGHRFAVLHASGIEAERFRAAGQLTLAGNGSIFTDERNFAEDAEPLSGLLATDALYIARFARWKNHHLMEGLDRPLMVYAEPKADEAERHAAVRELCSSAQFVNHLLGGGDYRYLDRGELNAVMSSARVALALSTVEGFMRASIESLLAGLPVVSVPSSGGRDAFYTADTALIVNPDAGSVRAGVAEMVARRLTRSEVRQATLHLLNAARRQFLDDANRIAQAEFGPTAPRITLEPLFDFTVRYCTLGKALELMA